MDIKILYEDNFIIVAEKPPKIPVQKDKTNDLDLLSILKERLSREHKVENPYIGLVHRLDRPVGGAILYAKTKPANAFLSKELQDRNIDKKYLAVVCGKPETDQGVFIDKLLKIGSKNMSVVRDTKDAKEAILEYKLIETNNTDEYGPLSLLEIDLKTGRHHQIRVQMSHHGLPLWGDTKYNEEFANKTGWSQIALWSYKLSFRHPKTKQILNFISNPYDEYPWNQFKISE